jgi:uncharacterized protein YjbI with pentapeptide repeats
MRLGRRLCLLALASIGGVICAAPASGAEVECLRAQTPPAPPAGGAVFARALEPGSSPNVVVIPAGSKWTASGSCAGAQQVMTNPGSIVVGAGGALLLKDQKANRLSAWGARDARLGGPAPILFPGRADWTTTEAAVVDPEYLLNVFNSCRSCSLPGVQFTPVQGYFPDRVAYMRHLNGADLSGATLTGDFSSWNFADANLRDATVSRASLAGAFLDHTRVDHADFDGADLRGAQLTALRYDAPPTFTGVRIGPFGGSCTAFRDTDLVTAKLTLARVERGCEASPLAPGSSVALGLLSQVADTLHEQRQVNVAYARFVATAADRGKLAGADLSGVNLSRASFTGFPARFVKTRFDGATLAGASFDLADLSGASFRDVSAAGASFRSADLADQGDIKAANFSGSKTDLTNANFVDADVSAAEFVGADVSGAVFSSALAVETDFTGVRAEDAKFNGTHIYGNGRAFDGASNLRGADFNRAVLAGDVDRSGGFDFTHTDLTGAKFDGTQCIGCNFAASTLTRASFEGAYLPGASFAGVFNLSGANLLDARLYCGDRSNASCKRLSGPETRWAWPLVLGEGEDYGPVPFADTNLASASLNDVAACPDGKSGQANPAGCAGNLQPDPSKAPPIPAPCSAAGPGACPTEMSTIFNAGDDGVPLALARATPPTWATTLTRQGLYAAFDDGTIRLLRGGGASEIVAGRHETHCEDPMAKCGDGGPADRALLGRPSALAVGLDGSLYMADPALHRVRRIDPSGTIDTVAGRGRECRPADQDCGSGRQASNAALAGPYGVWVDPAGEIYLADGHRGVLKVRTDGRLFPVAARDFDVRSVAGVPSGDLYASTNNPDHILKVDQETGSATTTKVVGTGTSGYNGNTNRFGMLAPGTSVQINNPRGLAIGLDGDVLFADTDNHLIRAYVPSSGHVTDPLAGVVSTGAPRGGFNGDGHWADETQLSNPRAVSAARNGLVAIADSGNRRVRQFGPSPAGTRRGGARRARHRLR